MGSDAEFTAFFLITEGVRKIGYRTMITSLVCLNGSFVVSVFLYFEGRMRYAASGAALVMAVGGFVTWRSVISHASLFLF